MEAGGCSGYAAWALGPHGAGSNPELLTVWPRASHLTSLHHTVLVCKMGMYNTNTHRVVLRTRGVDTCRACGTVPGR